VTGDRLFGLAAYTHVRVPDEPATWRCSCGETDIEKRYGGPADHEDALDAPCESCVMESFAESG
jgi:hypothetical protein